MWLQHVRRQKASPWPGAWPPAPHTPSVAEKLRNALFNPISTYLLWPLLTCTSIQTLTCSTYLSKGGWNENFKSGTEEVTWVPSQGQHLPSPPLLCFPASFCRPTFSTSACTRGNCIPVLVPPQPLGQVQCRQTKCSGPLVTQALFVSKCTPQQLQSFEASGFQTWGCQVTWGTCEKHTCHSGSDNLGGLRSARKQTFPQAF